jgi:rhodanese-related sulfurtransferase
MAHSTPFVALCEAARARITEVTVREASGGPWTLVDIREDHEWERGHIPGAQHVGRGILERDALTHWQLDTPIALYCGGGYRSALAADSLQQMGFSRVVSVAGGYREWRRLQEG